ncbi:MAG: RnfABCDGE type electron transport complex subunit D [Spirochaetales bacterium]|nr:RnfABCDGE type electron transport complex subunit D [Spirochaetales bacterium]
MEKKYNLLNVSSPHFHDSSSTRKIMLDVVIALVPAIIAAVVIFGAKALLLIATCVVSAVLAEYIFNLIVKKPCTIGDFSAVVTGVLLALNLGTDVTILQAVIGSVFAIVFVKGLFGGIGKNFANPAITARVFMLLCFSTVTSFTVPKTVELVSSATPLVNLKAGSMDLLPSLGQMFLGLHGGSIGETCIIALIIGWIYLSVRKVIKWYIPFAYIATVFVLFLVSSLSPMVALYEILSGGLFIGAIFMATDYSSTPLHIKGKVVFCILAGIITFIIRKFCGYPEGVSFSILICNLLVPYIEHFTRNIPLGGSANGK